MKGFFWLIRYLKDPLRKNSIFLIATQFLIALFGFLFWMIVARLYSDEEVGLATALVSAVLLLTSFSRLGVDIGLIRFLPNEEKKSGMINTCFTLVGLFSMLLATVFILGLDLWSPTLLFVRENVNYILLFILFTGSASIVVLIQQGIFVALRSTQFSFTMQVIGGLRLLLPIFLIASGAFGIFTAWGLASCISLVVGILLILRIQPKYRPIPIIKKKIFSTMLHFSLGNYIAESFREIPGFLLPLIIVNVLEPEMGAYFYVAWTIAGALFMIPYATNFALLAEGSYQLGELRENIVKAVKLMFLLLIPAIAAIFLLAKRVLTFGFGEEYADNGFELLWILALSGIPVAFNNLYITIKRIEKQIKPIIYMYGFIALFTVGVGYVLMSEMELVGIGIAWILSQGLVTLVIGLAMVRRWAKGL